MTDHDRRNRILAALPEFRDIACDEEAQAIIDDIQAEMNPDVPMRWFGVGPGQVFRDEQTRNKYVLDIVVVLVWSALCCSLFWYFGYNLAAAEIALGVCIESTKP